MNKHDAIEFGIMAACTLMLTSIVRLLEEKGVVGVDEFSAALDIAVEKGRLDTNIPAEFPRADLMMMERVSKGLKDKKQAQKGWKPTVIDGGLPDLGNPEKSD